MLPKEFQKITILATCNNTGKNGINEVLKRDEVKKVLLLDQTAKEINLVETLLFEIAKEHLATYGLQQTQDAAHTGAIKILLLTTDFIETQRENNKYQELESILNLVESNKGEIHIISAEHEGGKKLNGLGGIGAILRYKV